MRIELNNYLKTPITKWPEKIVELLDVADELLGLTNESISHSNTTNPYYHHDLVKLYRSWKANSWKLFGQDMKHFSEEYDLFYTPDSVPFSPLKEELPDFPSLYGLKWLEDIRNEVKEKRPVLYKAKNKILKLYPRGSSIRKITVIRVPDGEERYEAVLNDSENFYLSRKTGGTGALLYDIATSKTNEVSMEEYKNGYKYLNSNKKHPFYKNGKFSPTAIIGKKGDSYMALISIRAITQETYKNKKKVVNPS